MDSTTKTALFLGGGVLGLVLIGAALRPKAAQAATTGPKRLALIGDSLASGLAPELAKIYGPNFQAETRVGTSTKQWAEHAPACGTCGDWLVRFKPDVTLVVLGTNDGGVAYEKDYQAIRDALQALGSHVVWVQPPTMPGRSLAAVRATIMSLNVQVVPEYSVPLSPDGIHPTGAGFAMWAKKIVENL